MGRSPSSGLSRNHSLMFGDMGTSKEALGGTLILFIQKGKLYRDTESLGKMDPYVEVEYRDKKF